MLKTTISRLKKVCAIAFVPRILRGELRYTPGKFEKFTYTLQRTAQKSTKCSNPKKPKSIKKKTPEDPQKYAVSTVCENAVKSEFLDASFLSHFKPKPIKDIPRVANQISNPLYKEKSACRCEKCNKDENISRNIPVKGTPLHGPAPACHCNDCQRVIANIFGDSDPSKRQPNMSDLLSTIAHVHMKGDSGNSKLQTDGRIQPKAYNIPETNNNKQPEPKKKEEFKEDKSLVKDSRTGPNCGTFLMNQKGDENTDGNWMYTNLYEIAPEENTSIPSNKKEQKIVWTDEYGNNYGENSLNFEPNMTIDTETLKMYRTLMKKNTNYEDTEAGKVSGNVMEKSNKISEAQVMASSFAQPSTPNNAEENLKQKIEHIEETPMVEAANSKIDGFNTTPKVLTNEERAINLTQNAFDEVAKLCLGSKQKQIDEILLREMDKLSVPITAQKKEHMKPASNKEGTSNLGDRADDLHELKKNQDVSNCDNAIPSALPNSSLSCHVKNPKKTELGMAQPDPDTILTRKAWESQLDPKHVLTCNETCPISPKPLTDCCGNFEGTESIYDRNKFFVRQDDKRNQPVKQDTWNFVATSKKIAPDEESVEEDVILEQEEPLKHTEQKNTVGDSLQQSIKAASAIITGATEGEKPSIKEDSVAASVNFENDENISSDKRNLEYENDEDDYKIDLERLESASEQLHATSEQLLATSEQLLATSDQLQETSEQLRAATEILQVSSGNVDPDNANALLIGEPSFEQLNKTSERLRNSGEKFETLTESLESTSEKLQDLCENFEKILLTQIGRPMDNKTKVTNAQSMIPSLLPSTGALDSKSTTNSSPPAPPSPSPPKQKDNVDKAAQKKQTESEDINEDSQSSSKLASLAQQGATMNPLKSMTSDLSSLLRPLPQVNEDTKLSELMKIVKERNRLIDTSNYLNASNMQTTKNIPPLSMPMQKTPVKVINPGYPEIKPPLSKGVPNTKKPKLKFSACDLNTLGIGHSPSHYNQDASIRYDIFEHDVYQGMALTEELEPASELKDEIAMKLKSLGEVLRSSYQQRKIETLETIMLARTHRRRNRSRLFRSKNFDPWAPIPSWPQPKQNKRPKLQCHKDGCKSFPPTRAEKDPDCGLRPCDTFPIFPSRKFSTLDYFAILLADNDV